MKVYYLRWNDRDEIYVPNKILIEISYGFPEEKTSFYFSDKAGPLGLREIIAKKEGKVKGDVLEFDDYQIQLPAEDGFFEIKEKLVYEIMEARGKPKKFKSLVEELVVHNLERIILTEKGLKRLALNLNIPYGIN